MLLAAPLAGGTRPLASSALILQGDGTVVGMATERALTEDPTMTPAVTQR